MVSLGRRRERVKVAEVMEEMVRREGREEGDLLATLVDTLLPSTPLTLHKLVLQHARSSIPPSLHPSIPPPLHPSFHPSLGC